MSENIQEKATTPGDIYQAIPAARPLSDFAVERVGDDLVILDGESMQYHTLNLAAAQIWQACDGVNSTNRIASELGLPIELVESTVSELGEAGLLQSPSAQWDSTLNRRRASKLIAAGLVGASDCLCQVHNCTRCCLSLTLLASVPGFMR
ncbi:MAG: PqqD family protein [Thermomicrobiales bacterium]